jgi:hypothetical protein
MAAGHLHWIPLSPPAIAYPQPTASTPRHPATVPHAPVSWASSPGSELAVAARRGHARARHPGPSRSTRASSLQLAPATSCHPAVSRNRPGREPSFRAVTATVYQSEPVPTWRAPPFPRTQRVPAAPLHGSLQRPRWRTTQLQPAPLARPVQLPELDEHLRPPHLPSRVPPLSVLSTRAR